MMKKNILVLFVLTLAICIRVSAQDAPPYIFVVGGGPGFPQGSTGNLATGGANFVAGGGVNTPHGLGLDGEFMWHDLPPKSSVIALTGAPNGSARLYSVTGNAILQSSEAHKAGLYGILGIGWYHRSWELTHPTLALGTTCLPSYAFWGVVCTNGLVSANAVINSGSQNAFGWNLGGGLTYRLGDSHVKAFTEARWHYAYFSHFNTKVIPLTFGLRW